LKNLLKAGGVVALSGGLFAVLYPMAGGSVDVLASANHAVGGCSTVGGQSGVGGQSTVGGQSGVCGVPPTTPFVGNIPAAAVYGGSFVATADTNGDGRTSVTSGTAFVCKVGNDRLTVRFSGVGTCTLTAHVSAGSTYAAADGVAQSFAVGRATPSVPTITNVPTHPLVGGRFHASVASNSKGKRSVTSLTPQSCAVGPNGTTVNFVAAGQCVLVAHVAATTRFVAASGLPQALTLP